MCFISFRRGRSTNIPTRGWHLHSASNEIKIIWECFDKSAANGSKGEHQQTWKAAGCKILDIEKKTAYFQAFVSVLFLWRWICKNMGVSSLSGWISIYFQLQKLSLWTFVRDGLQAASTSQVAAAVFCLFCCCPPFPWNKLDCRIFFGNEKMLPLVPSLQCNCTRVGHHSLLLQVWSKIDLETFSTVYPQLEERTNTDKRHFHPTRFRFLNAKQEVKTYSGVPK